MNKNNNKTKNSIVIQTVIAFILCLLLIVLLVFQFNQIWQMKVEQATLNEKIVALQNKNMKYSDELEYYLSSDYLEDIAHQNNKYDPTKEFVN